MKSLFTLFLISSFALCACSPSTATRGNYIFAEDIQSIQPVITTQFEVLNTLGTPTAKAVFDENTWYYVGLKTEKKSFFDEKVTDRQIYQIVFSEDKSVKSITKIEGEPVEVPVASRVTPTSGNEVTALQQILGNIGKFNPQSK
ncbi:MAG: hypothetical protein COB76_02710 [Alphaproteobacteria bacterium]|nr:MAG: hypothetical protein COB76_02710 [Alphaproteobacteria bacterium]